MNSSTIPSVVDLFWNQSEQTPTRIAIVQSDTTWTYGDLRHHAAHIAHILIDYGVRPGDRVGVCLDRSPIAIASMIGIQLAGAAFVPLDPEYPVDRINYMVGDANIGVVIGHDRYRTLFDTPDSRPLAWLDAGGLLSGFDRNKPTNRDALESFAENQLAYVMYTSGSTGRPKGVLINHAALTTYCLADCDVYQLQSDDRTLQFSTLNFDIAIEEIFPPLLIGSCVVIRPIERADSVNELSHLIQTNGITAVHLATAYWHQWVDLMDAMGDRIPSSLRLMIVTGEKVSVDHYHRWQSMCDHEVLWCNAYGPTEATVTATVFIPDPDFDAANMPIGKPLPGYTAVILDDQLRDVPMGETGQLFLGGLALADGYLNRDDLTRAAFIERVDANGQNERLYRTGDVARLMSDGNIDFGGRVDHQIKLGSYRIEPGEIEAALTSIDGVCEAVVVAESIENQKVLLAYVGVGLNAELPTPPEQQAADLSRALRDQVPAYMIPTRYVITDVFPKTINGKIDRSQLPKAETAVTARDEDFVAPMTELQTQLAAIWCAVLHLPSIGIRDDFFFFGGSSLLVTQVVAQIKQQLGLELPVRDFFANPTIELASRHIDAMLGRTDASMVSAEDTLRVQRERLPLVEAMFFSSGSHDLFGVHYSPPKACVRLNRSVVLCHAFGHEYARSYRNLQQLAVHLAQQGFDVLRFDYAGTGNSGGNAIEATPHVMMKNIHHAAAWMRQRHAIETVSLVGIRLGATLATCAKVPNVDQLLLWDPITQGKAFLDHLDDLHQRTLTNGTRFNRPRDSGSIDQAFGCQLNHIVRKQLSRLNLDFSSASASTNTTVLLTRDSTCEVAGNQPNTIHLEDEIGWGLAELTESAFASPAATRQITACLLAHPCSNSNPELLS